MLRLVKIVSASMEPTLLVGDVALITPKLTLSKGDVVVFKREGQLVVKRVAGFLSSETVFVTGDNPCISLDSRTYGPIARKDIVGKVKFILCSFDLSGLSTADIVGLKLDKKSLHLLENVHQRKERTCIRVK